MINIIEEHENEKWEEYLTRVDNSINNVEYVDSISSMAASNNTYDEVLRSLKLLDQERQSILKNDTSKIKYINEHYCKTGKNYNAKISSAVKLYLFSIVEEVLKWMDVSKSRNIVVNHNIKSAEIYKKEHSNPFSLSYRNANYSVYNEIVESLISSHGLIGQAIRGEVPLLASLDSFNYITKSGYLNYNELRFVVEELNYCIIAGVKEDLYKKIEYQVSYVIAKNMETLVNNLGMRCEAYNNTNRFLKLMGNKEPDGVIVKANDNTSKDRIDKRVSTFLSNYDLWFFQPAMEHFSFADVAKMLGYIDDTIEQFDFIKAVSFKGIADNIYYDYKDKKRLNIYKIRLIEYHIHNDFVSDHVSINMIPDTNTESVDIEITFSDAAESLVNFCMAAEISESATYNKCIRILYDALNLRKDEFDRLNNEDDYIDTMNDSTENSSKRLILEYIPDDAQSIADIGAGGGELVNKILANVDDYTFVDAYDVSDAMIKNLTKRFMCDENVRIKQDNIVFGTLSYQYDCIIFSSILHEIFSYTEYEPGHKFRIENVELALHNAYDSLNNNGKVIIRDGIKCDDEMVVMHMTKDCMLSFVNYTNDFKGATKKIAEHLQETDDKDFPYSVKINKDYAREFMYTYTWGPESYANEVQEQFGYYTLQEYKDVLEDIGYSIEQCTSLLEPGYEDHLKDSCYISDENGDKLPYPDSTCFIVAVKEEY